MGILAIFKNGTKTEQNRNILFNFLVIRGLKKMPINLEEKSIHFPRFFSNYYPAVLREHKSGWMIEYYVRNPYIMSDSSKEEYIRKTQKVNHLIQRYGNKSAVRRHVNKMVM